MDREVEQLERGLLGREAALGLDGSAELPAEGFDRLRPGRGARTERAILAYNADTLAVRGR